MLYPLQHTVQRSSLINLIDTKTMVVTVVDSISPFLQFRLYHEIQLTAEDISTCPTKGHVMPGSTKEGVTIAAWTSHEMKALVSREAEDYGSESKVIETALKEHFDLPT